ncbi:glycerol-3-phosphate 1-O-acyltransferase PlsY [Legionella sp. km772]|uniref:glycerol-3-phosphate 1-O-acyltransferase PlsY n=1 Tax=Legionella sp. km772 TaxID=2498111 RepID=UPI000F8CC850|nr:glycerol-3-phosphate 1-O-acyltransferase PlsY [Legionella sp. km772]RUR07115.1 glycerol-3-phosphate 1-O-acyltransferase [Legionella sp. km772]
MLLAIVLILISYLMGSICSAIIVCSIFNLPDPREEGSKNPGATNVLRLAGKQYAALVLLVDILKGTIPVLLAQFLNASPTLVAFTVLVAVLGHMYPIFFNFKGGKGVATAIGALLGFHFIIGVMVVATWLLVVNFSRYSSLASIIAIILSPLYALLVTQDINIFPPLCIMAILILFKHKNNITRLIDGNEPKVFIKENVIKEIMEDTTQANHAVVPELEVNKTKPTAIKKKTAPKKISTEPEPAPAVAKATKPQPKAKGQPKTSAKKSTTRQRP